jgi:hypothetical protein
MLPLGVGMPDCRVRARVFMDGGARRAVSIAACARVRTLKVVADAPACCNATTRCFRIRSLLADSVIALLVLAAVCGAVLLADAVRGTLGSDVVTLVTGCWLVGLPLLAGSFASLRPLA